MIEVSAKKDVLTMQMLSVLEEGDNLSQRKLATTLGIALGATNAHIKQCLADGFIQKMPINKNSFNYQLTTKGKLERSRLNNLFIADSFKIFSQARESYTAIFNDNTILREKPFYIVGTNALAEAAFLSITEEAMPQFKGFYSPAHQIGSFLRKPVIQEMAETAPHALFVFALLKNSLQSYEQLREIVGDKRIFVPEILQTTV